MAHARAKLTVLGRQLLVDRVQIDGWKPTDAAKAMGVSRQTAYKWLRRFRDEGPAGLKDRTSAPQRCPHRLDPRRWPPSWPLASRPSMGLTAWPMRWAVLVRPSTECSDGADLAPELHRPADPTVVRYERARPGELLHVDIKKLGRIREEVDGGSMARLRPARPNAKEHWLRLPPCGHRRSQPGCFRPGPGRREGADVRPLRVRRRRLLRIRRSHHRTGDDRQCPELPSSKDFKKPSRPWHPPTHRELSASDKWKAERFNRTLLEEFAYKTLFTSNGQRLNALGPWLEAYNSDRPHTAIGGLTPLQRLRQQR